jgi:hypothetical protein
MVCDFVIDLLYLVRSIKMIAFLFGEVKGQ